MSFQKKKKKIDRLTKRRVLNKVCAKEFGSIKWISDSVKSILTGCISHITRIIYWFEVGQPKFL